MGLRILPFRQYDENNVVNMFAFATGSANANLVGKLDEAITSNKSHGGVFVKVASADLNKDPIEYADNSYLGKTSYPHVGGNAYPSVPHTVSLAGASDSPLGITLYQTALKDENDEKRLYYPQKALENYAVLPGQAVPVATKGIFTLHESAIANSSWATVVPGRKLKAAANGKCEATAEVSGERFVGKVLATGERQADGKGASVDAFSGKYAVVQIDC